MLNEHLTAMKIVLLLIAVVLSLSLYQARASIPFTQVTGMYKQTKEDYKDISPFWGMVAIHGGLLERIRFFGPYQTSGEAEESADRPQDKIAELIQVLFPSPDGIQFVANTSGSARNPAGYLSTKLELINDIIITLINTDSRENKISTIISKFKPVSRNLKPKPIREFAELLLDAYQMEEELANPAQPQQQLYPSNIVIISLLGYFCLVADNKNDLQKLPDLMEEELMTSREFNLSLPLPDSINSIEEKKLYLFESLQSDDEELIFFKAKAQASYGSLFIDDINYRTDTVYEGAKFPDCGETSLRNLLMVLLGHHNGLLSVETLERVEQRLAPQKGSQAKQNDAPFQKMKLFFKSYSYIPQATTKTVHNEWVRVVSDLNNGNPVANLNDVQYGRSPQGSVPIYEIKSNYPVEEASPKGIFNMLNVIAKLIPDKALNQPWLNLEKEGFKQASQKLERLCELFSREGYKLSWQDLRTGSPTINGTFPILILFINDIPAYQWEFEMGHFSLRRINQDNDAWFIERENYQRLRNEWIASLFPFSPDSLLRTYEEDPYIPMDMVYSPALKNSRKILRSINLVLSAPLPQFIPLLNRWIEKTIPLNEPAAIKRISYLLYPWKAIKAISKIIRAPKLTAIKERMDRIHIKTSLTGFYGIHGGLFSSLDPEYLFDITKTLLSKGADLNIYNDNEDTPLLYLMRHPGTEDGNLRIARFLIDVGADVNASDKNRRTPLHYAVKLGNVPLVEALLRAKADINVQDAIGDTPLHTALEEKRSNLVSLLLKKQPDVNIANDFRITPLFLAVKGNDESIVQALLTAGANPNHMTQDATILGAALSQNNKAVIKLLIDAGADVNARHPNFLNISYLDYAIVINDVEMVRILLDHGALVNIKKDKGLTPLNQAITTHNIDILKLLIDHGADMHLPDGEGLTPFERLDKEKGFIGNPRLFRAMHALLDEASRKG
ncbi:ankyrin repeat domain-containing protein [Candidatus Odyssella thessalonicensis]|uniref:ankyrin repeat domain-containing protein n=1 Tax=Candidatus Odyssella thessalonicensis TaxID=84647 RepID=UPI001585AB69|nr:ankyrin repeat domain-containing protein [Candidatus Odyssella thessalonicensis]